MKATYDIDSQHLDAFISHNLFVDENSAQFEQEVLRRVDLAKDKTKHIPLEIAFAQIRKKYGIEYVR